MSILKNFIGLEFDSSKLLILRYFIIKSPITLIKLPFLKTKQSNLVGGNPTKAKTAYIEAVFKNGARYYALIGLKIMMNISSLSINLGTITYRKHFANKVS